MELSLNSSEIEIIFKDEREDDTFNPEKALENFLNKNLDKFLLPLIPPPLEPKNWKDGKKWDKWEDWKTPVKWIDYFTKKELSEIRKTIKEAILSEIPKIVTEDEINVKFDDILKKIKNLPTWGGWALFLRQLMDVNVGNPTAQQYWLTYNPSRSEFSLSAISANGVWGTITWTLSDQTDLQTALDAKVNKSGDTMTWDLLVPDEAYGVGWNGSMEVPTKNAIYDKIQTSTETDTLQTVTDRGSTTTNAITSSRTTTTSPVDWFVASTSSTATSGNQKASTDIKWTGSWWKSNSPTSARQVDFRSWVLPVQESSNEPTAIWKLQSQVNNWGWTDHFWIDNKVGGLGAYFNSTGSNGSPWTTRAITINNTGSYSWIDWTFSGTRKVADGANSSGWRDFYASGWSYFSYIDWNSNSLFSYNYPTGLYHTWGGWFWGRVSAWQGSNPSSTLSSSGSFATKGRRVTSNYTLTVDDSAIYADASTAACSGTPTYSCSHWTNQTDCEKWDAHGGCSWYAGSDCSEFNNTDVTTCESGHSGCTYDTASCSWIWDESSCNWQTGCSWTSHDCSVLSEWSCWVTTGCTVNTADCSTFNWNESGCSGQSGCSVSSSNTCPSQMDEWSCVGAGCSWDGMTCTGDNSTCTGTYFTSCSGTYYDCQGSYYTGTCSGIYWAACTGTSTCSGIDDSTNCGFETGCTWATSITLNLPSVITVPWRHYWIYNDSSSSADVIVQPYSGDQVDRTTSYTLGTYKDAIHLQAFSESVSCGSFNEWACTPSGCSKEYSYCSWDSMSNTCSGNAVCDGIWDQTTCESTTYFSYCSGSYYSVKNWYLLSRS